MSLISLRNILNRRSALRLALFAAGMRLMRANESSAIRPRVSDMTRNIPPRRSNALTGSEFAASVLDLDRHEREQAILEQLSEGNLPSLLRNLTPVNLSHELAYGTTLAATIFVMPEYLAIGSDSDFLRIPMNLHTAAAIARRFGFELPTKRIVDAIYDQSSCRFTPQPLPPGPQMASTEYYRVHNALIDKQAQSLGFPLCALVSGHKKDVVLTNRLATRPGQIAIYGWHRGPGDPIQPLSTVHGAGYADYSHGIRLVAGTALIEGRLRSVHHILRDPVLAHVLSDEGPIRISLA